MKKSYKDRIADLGLSYHKEMTVLLLMNVVIILLGGAIYYFFKSWVVIPILVTVAVMIDILYFSRYSSLEKEKDNEHLDELISLLSYFEIFISNGNNVYTSFRMLLPYCSPFLEETINSFLSQVDDDKSVGPFITFASKFNSQIIETLMLSVYQMVDNGENSGQFMEFNILFSNISKEHQTNLIEARKRKLASLDAWPLFGSGALTIILAIAILNIVGDYINVI